MQIIRATFNVLNVLSTTLLIGFLAFDKLSKTNNQYLIDLILGDKSGIQNKIILNHGATI